ncbi:flagellar basal body-associated FliL family protein [Labrenzia sp. 011]|uniref:flagellar basal body-associated FliL family protein n=1 Tax=Labrenzia sp. 011 TaxID=2171494 RepID=UPI000D51CC0B|nr:flagellar basal body-associated FliL family protein [Labrenzia sp. 011]PVB62681.1 flagellar basal body protein FliL [Labrenzia sp. 011]
MPNLIEAPIDGAGSQTRKSSFLGALLLLTLVGGGSGAVFAKYIVDYTEQEVQGRMREQQSYSETLPFSISTRVQKLDPLVTNLASPKDSWIRVQASVLLEEETEGEVGLLRKKVEDDFLGYLRTLTLAHLEGAAGLQHLKEDLTERAKTRSKGLIHEVILESVVIQ